MQYDATTEDRAVRPKRGLRFRHRHFITTAGEPEVCWITTVREGRVFFRVGSPDGMKFYSDITPADQRPHAKGFFEGSFAGWVQ